MTGVEESEKHETGSAARAAGCAPDRPICIYQVHLNSWMRVPEDGNRPLSSSEIAPKLADHLEYTGFTHAQIHSPGEKNPGELGCLAGYFRQRNIGTILESRDLGGADVFDGRSWDGRTQMFDFEYQWDMDWAEGLRASFAAEANQRKSRPLWAMRRNFDSFGDGRILPLPEKLVSRPRESLLTGMPGDEWQKFANLRLFFACQYLLPGKKLVFMGDEFGQPNPWRSETSLDWHLARPENMHGKMMLWTASLNRFYRGEKALHQTDSQPGGFQWIDASENAPVVSFLRKDREGRDLLLVALNFTPATYHNYRVGVPRGGFWAEVLNSDGLEFGGSGQGNFGGVESAPFGWNFQSHSLMITVPPLGVAVFKSSGV
jgi:1,4-alpha-glucan branching enzyme